MPNGLACPVAEDWEQAKQAIERGKDVQSMITDIKSKSEHLESLPEIASSLKNLNRNLTITLVVLGSLLLIKELRGGDLDFKAGAGGIEIGRSK